MKSQQETDCLVVGGGIIGLSLAEELSRHGLTAQVLDVPRGRQIASWAAAGILPSPAQSVVEDPVERLRALSHRIYPEWCAQLQRDSGCDVEFRTTGGLYVGRTPGESAALQAQMAQSRSEGVRLEPLAARDLARLEPALGLGDDLRCAYLLPDEAQVRPPRLLQALRTILRARDVAIRDDLQVTGWAIDRESVVLLTNQGPTTARWICIAAGPWSASLLRPLGIELQVEPRRGQILAWQTTRPLLQRILNEGPRYLVSRTDGWLLAGSTVEDVGFDPATTDHGAEELTAFAHRWLPSLRRLKVRDHWAGLRPFTSGGRPLLGQMAPWNNLLIAAGHFRSGIHLAPVTTRLLRQIIRGESTEIDLSPFLPTGR